MENPSDSGPDMEDDDSVLSTPKPKLRWVQLRQHPGRGHSHLPSEPAAGRGEPRGGPSGGPRGRKGRRCVGQQALWGVGSGEGVDRRHRSRGGPGSAGLPEVGCGEGRVQSGASRGQPRRRPCPGRRGGWDVDLGGTSGALGLSILWGAGGGTGGPPGAGVWDSADGRGPGAGGGLQPGLEPGEPKSEAGRSVAWLIIRR